MLVDNSSRIFVSYARKDGEEFAQYLRKRLVEEYNLSVWQDIKDMEAGEGWWQQIEVAIKSVEYLVLVLTPSALESDIVQKEWHFARQQGVCVVPLITPLGIDFNKMPRWMRDTHIANPAIIEQWERFVLTLRAPCNRRHIPFMSQDLPNDFVTRKEQFDALINCLLDKDLHEPIAITTSLIGAGGFGKTTLARAICHDKNIQWAFDDGILWITIGENPSDLTGKLNDLIEIVTGERPGFLNIETATAKFAEVLSDRRILLVIDDVWDATHLKPFMQGGTHCTRLITTRDKASLPLKTVKIDVDAMSTEEALLLLSKEIPSDSTDGLLALASRLGKWPLLLRLVNARLIERVNEYGESLEDALSYINQTLDEEGLTAFDATNPSERSQAAAATINASLKQLSANERTAYTKLAVFPEDIPIPLYALEKLWSLKQISVQNICHRLHQLSLLLDFNPSAKHIYLHDVIRSYLNAEADTLLPKLHQNFLAAYNPENKEWSQIANDGYIYNSLAYHLVEAQYLKELCILITSSPSWMEARFTRVDSCLKFVDDIRFALRQINDPIAPPDCLILFELYSALLIAQSRFTYYNGSVLQTLILLGESSFVEAYASTDKSAPFHILLSAIIAFHECGFIRSDLLNIVLEQLPILKEAESRTITLVNVSRILLEFGQIELASSFIEEACKLSLGVQAEWLKSDYLLKVADILFMMDRQDRAFEICAEVENVILEITPLENQASKLNDLIYLLIKYGKFEHASTTTQKLRLLINSISRSSIQVRELCKLAETLDEFEQPTLAPLFSQISEIIRRSKWNQPFDEKAFAQRFLAESLAKTKRFSQASEVIESMDKPSHLASYAISELRYWQAQSLIEKHLVKDAFEIAQAIPEIDRKVSAFEELALFLAKSGNITAAKEALDIALAAQREARTERHLNTRVRFVAREVILLSLCHEQEHELAVKALSLFNDKRDMISTGLIAATMGKVKETIEALETVQDAEEQAHVLYTLWKSLIDQGQIKELDTITNRLQRLIYDVTDKTQFANIQSKIAEILYVNGNHEQAIALFNDTYSVIQSINDDVENPLVNYMGSLARLGLINEILEKISRFDGRLKCRVCIRIYRILSDRGDIVAAQELVKVAMHEALSIKSREQQAYSLRDVATAYAYLGFHEESHNIVKMIPDERQKTYAADDVKEAQAILLLKNGNFASALRLILQSNRLNIDELLVWIASSQKALNQLSPGLYREILSNVLRIAAWERQDWKEIYMLLT